MKSPFYWTVRTNVAVDCTFRTFTLWVTLGVEVIFIHTERFENCMNDLDWVAEHTWDIGEELGGEHGDALKDTAIVIWDIRAEIIALRSMQEGGEPARKSETYRLKSGQNVWPVKWLRSFIPRRKHAER